MLDKMTNTELRTRVDRYQAELHRRAESHAKWISLDPIGAWVLTLGSRGHNPPGNSVCAVGHFGDVVVSIGGVMRVAAADPEHVQVSPQVRRSLDLADEGGYLGAASVGRAEVDYSALLPSGTSPAEAARLISNWMGDDMYLVAPGSGNSVVIASSRDLLEV